MGLSKRAFVPAVAALGVMAACAAPAAAARDGGHAAARPTVHVHGMRVAVGVSLPRTYLPHLTPRNTVFATNWSGYAVAADRGIHIRFVVANFTVPSLNCANSPLGSSGTAYAGDWAGLDGLNSNTVEQTGVDAFCDSSGTPSYYAWYEMYPLAPVAFTGVSPGDAVNASVFFNGTGYNLVLKDLTSGGTINTTQPCPAGSKCSNTSAEVITEDPGGAVANGVNLADFGMANFTGTGVTAVGGKHGTLASLPNFWASTRIVMVDPSGNRMAVPSSLYAGQAFNVGWRGAS